MILAGVALSAVAVGCGSSEGSSSDSSSSTGSGSQTGSGGNDATGGSGGGTGGSDASSGSSEVTTTTTGGSSEGDNDNSLEDASEYDLAEPALLDGELPTVGDSDYYKFTGTKGQAVGVEIYAQAIENAAMDPSFPDTVITLLDKDGNALGLNDDPSPRFDNDSKLYTILPDDGDYYVKVQECWTFKEEHPDAAIGCAEPSEKPNSAYQFFAYDVDAYIANMKAADKVPPMARHDEAATDFTVLPYVEGDPANAPGRYMLSRVHGTFDAKGDVDVFSVTIPDNLVFHAEGDTGGRATGFFDFYTTGAEGNGSTSAPGKVYVADADAPAVRLAEVNLQNGGDGITMPVTLGKSYLLFVEQSGKDLSANEFYFMNQFVWRNADVEAETSTGTNDTWDTAESVAKYESSSLPAGVNRFYVDGNLPAGTDADYFKLAIPAGTVDGSVMTVACAGNYIGSGLKELTVGFVDASGADVGATGTENVANDSSALVENVAIPAGATEVGLKLSASGLLDGVTSDYYSCIIQMNPGQ